MPSGHPAPTAGRTFALDPARPLPEASGNGHNRWHPDIEPIARVASDGRNRHLDLNTAATGALNAMVEYLVQERGFMNGQAQIIVSVGADLRISVVNNPPNSVVSVAIRSASSRRRHRGTR